MTAMIDTRTAPYGALLIRLALGAMFLSHGLLKVFVFGFAGTAGYFESLGLPAALAYLTILAEVGGGLLLILGIYARVVAVLLIPVLAGAWIFAHADKGWLFSNAGGGWEYIAFLIAACAAVALTGPGAMALVNERR
jgi:putative oxidoreductase